MRARKNLMCRGKAAEWRDEGQETDSKVLKVRPCHLP